MKNLFFTVLVFLLVHMIAYAQVEEKIVPTDLKQQTIVTQPITLYKGFLRAGFAGGYTPLNKYFNDKSKKQFFGSNIWGKTWFVLAMMQYGVTDRLQLEIDLPYNITEQFQSYRIEAPLFQTDSVVAWKVKGSGISDLSFRAGYQLIKESTSRPALAAFLAFTAPTGEKNPTGVVSERNYKLPSGSGEPVLNLDLQLRKIIFPYSYTAYLGYKYSFGGSKIFSPGEEEKEFKSGGYVNIGGTFDLSLNDWIALQNGLDSFFYGKDEVEGVKEKAGKWIVQYFPRLNFQLKKLRLVQAVTVPLKGKTASADITYLLVAQYMF